MSKYQEAEVEADDDVIGDGDGGELEVAEVAGEGLGDDEHGIGGDAAEDGGAHYVPELLGFDPHPSRQLSIIPLFSILDCHV